jgi:GDP-mannose 6-dehydrogenase
VSAKERIVVFGLGYVGCVSAACLARLGHQVVGVDLADFKVKSLNEGRSPFYEPGLDELVQEVVAGGKLRATTDAREALDGAEIAFICVGTPSDKAGGQSSEQVARVATEIAACLGDRIRPLLVVIRSTVLPGTCERLAAEAFGDWPMAVVLSHPEFLREGSAIRDFMEPSLLVVGGPEPHRARVARIYEALDAKCSLVELRTAEMIKYACNAFHALKISFANEIAAVAGAQQVLASQVMSTLCEDHVLNISKAYLRPGFAFGGSCLPKDLRALVHSSSRLDLNLPLLSSILPSNEAHFERALDRIMELGAVNLGFFGLTFKENTDDLRESPTIALVERLIGKGRSIRVFDPNINMDLIHGANQRFLFEHIPHVGRLLNKRLPDMLDWANCVVIAQKPKDEHVKELRASAKPWVSLLGDQILD